MNYTGIIYKVEKHINVFYDFKEDGRFKSAIPFEQ